MYPQEYDLCTSKFETVLITLDSYYDLDTWYEPTCHQTKSNYDGILDHAHIRFVSEVKGAVGKIAKPGAVPRFLLLPQLRATTVVTRSHRESRNSYLHGRYKSLCLSNSGNQPLSMTKSFKSSSFVFHHEIL